MRHSPSFRTLRFSTSPTLRAAAFLLASMGVSDKNVVQAIDTDFRYLAADPSLRAQMQDVNVTMGQATYVGEALKLDQPWESPFRLEYPGSVVRDPGTGQWRMYYELIKTEHERFGAVATSDDGINWTKPELDITGTKYTNDPRNNFINHATQTWIGSPCVLVDPNAPADQRYRMSEAVFSAAGQPIGMYAEASADGLNWRRVGTIDNAPGPYRFDSQNVTFWDPKTQQYVAEMRWWYPADGDTPSRRGVFTKRSNTWDTTWTAPREFTIDPKEAIGPGPHEPDLYTPGIVPYHGQYVGMPAMYYHPGVRNADGPLYPTFMHSRDGTDWTFDDPSHPLLDLSAHGQDEETFGMAYPATTLIERDGELWIYYTYIADKHNSTPEWSTSQVHLAKLREDRFVGIESAPGSIGEWTTSAITLSSDPGHLILNALVEGSLRVELLDPDTMVALPGFSRDDATLLGAGDYLDAVARWNAGDTLNALAGRAVVLRFVMDDATMYGFRFEPTPEPSTIVLAITGWIGLLAYAWRRHR